MKSIVLLGGAVVLTACSRPDLIVTVTIAEPWTSDGIGGEVEFTTYPYDDVESVQVLRTGSVGDDVRIQMPPGVSMLEAFGELSELRCDGSDAAFGWYGYTLVYMDGAAMDAFPEGPDEYATVAESGSRTPITLPLEPACAIE